MEIKTPELKEFIKGLNKPIYDTINANKELMSEQFEELKDEHEKDRWVEIKNGETKRILLKDAVGTMHDDIGEIKMVLEPITDFHKVYKILCKYKKTSLISTGVFVFSLLYKIYF